MQASATECHTTVLVLCNSHQTSDTLIQLHVLAPIITMEKNYTIVFAFLENEFFLQRRLETLLMTHTVKLCLK